MRTPTVRLASLAFAGVAGLVLVGIAGVGSANAGPPANNGTIKIDGEEFDSHPNNEPHVGCEFEVDFYGFDAGEDLYADVTFSAQAPTVSAGESPVLRTEHVFIGEDDSSGGGSEGGLDATASFTLDFGNITPHPIQGFHVDVTVEVAGSKGNATKHKTLWTSACTGGGEPPGIPF